MGLMIDGGGGDVGTRNRTATTPPAFVGGAAAGNQERVTTNPLLLAKNKVLLQEYQNLLRNNVNQHKVWDDVNGPDASKDGQKNEMSSFGAIKATSLPVPILRRNLSKESSLSTQLPSKKPEEKKNKAPSPQKTKGEDHSEDKEKKKENKEEKKKKNKDMKSKKGTLRRKTGEKLADALAETTTSKMESESSCKDNNKISVLSESDTVIATRVENKGNKRKAPAEQRESHSPVKELGETASSNSKFQDLPSLNLFLSLPKNTMASLERGEESEGSTTSRRRESPRERRRGKEILVFRKRSLSEPFMHSWDYQSATKLKSAGVSDISQTNECLMRVSDDSVETLAPLPSPLSHMKKEGDEVIYSEVKGKKMITAGSVEQLVKHLADENFQDNDFISCFLITHPQFMSSVDLLERLRHRFVEFSKPPAHYTEEEKEKFNGSKTIFQIRVTNVVKKWVENHPYDFQGKALKAKLTQFLEAITAEGNSSFDSWATSILSALSKDTEIIDLSMAPEILECKKSNKTPSLTSGFQFLNVHPQELARQMTLLDFAIFRRIKPRELLCGAWAKKDNINNSPNVLAMIERFNMICYWCATEIIMTPILKNRVTVLTRFIEIGKHLLDLHNLHGVMTIYSALNMSGIQRLKQTWKNVTAKHIKIVKDFENLFDPAGNYRNYQNYLNSIEPPSIPILSLALTRLTSLEESPDKLEQGTFINFAKMRSVGQILEQLQKYRQQPYCFHEVASIKNFLLGEEMMFFTSEKEIYNQSKRTERPQDDIKNGTWFGSKGRRASLRF